MAAMRVYLGSDHAGFELKNEIIEHLKKNGHEPIDCGAYSYDAEDDYPAFCIAAAQKTVATPTASASCSVAPATASRSRRTRCPGPMRVGMEHRDGTLAREHNNAQVMGIGGRMHTTAEAVAIVDAFLAAKWSKAERHQRRIDILGEYERPTSRRRCPAPGLRMPEGHTLHRLARPPARTAARRFRLQPAGPLRSGRRPSAAAS